MAFKYIAKQIFFKNNRAYLSKLQYSGSLANLRMFSSYTKLEMPALSPTMEDGTIARWFKKEGEKINVGDLICDIQTDKATVGFESQEEGYLAKIIVPQNIKGIKVGNVIGVMVDEEEEISSKEVKDFASKMAADILPQQETPKKKEPEIIKAKSPEETQKLMEFDDDYERKLSGELEKFRCAPAALSQMRSYFILPSEIKGSGKGKMITKTDVILHVKVKGLVKGQKREQAVPHVEPQKVEPPKEEKKAAKEKPKQPSGAYDPYNPRVQSWKDEPISEALEAQGQLIKDSKCGVPLEYVTIYCSVDRVLESLQRRKLDINKHFDNYFIKVSGSVLRRIFKSSDLDAKLVSAAKGKQTTQFFISPNFEVVSQIKGFKLDEGSPFGAETPDSLLTIYQMDGAVEVLPIPNQKSLITLHYSRPLEEVELDVDESERFLDLMDITEKPVRYDLKFKRTKKVKVCMSYNIQRVDQERALKFMKSLQDILYDPDNFMY